jgi:hypothetical protein
MRVIHKTMNGWLIVGSTHYLDNDEIAASYGFETMGSLTKHLLKLAGESHAERDSKGHFVAQKKQKQEKTNASTRKSK